MCKHPLIIAVPLVAAMFLNHAKPASASTAAGATMLSQAKPSNSVPEPTYSNRIEVAGIKSGIPTGAVIGVRHCHSGALWLKQHCGENTAGGFSNEAAESLRKAIESGLSSAALNAGASETSSVGRSFFSDQPTSTAVKSESTPRFLLGVTITAAKLDSKQTMNVFTGNFAWKTEGRLKTLWEVYDNRSKKIVASESITVDSISVPGDNILAAVIQGVSRAAQQFLASKIYGQIHTQASSDVAPR